VDGERREHTLTAGEGFGEIALLRSVPRTATVTALIECELLEVGAKAFLGAVTSDLDGSGMAQLAVQERLAGDRAGQEQRVQDRPAD
jgi:CRP-like cAMP-binding protein